MICYNSSMFKNTFDSERTCVIMLKKIDDGKKITIADAAEKYAQYYICMVITEQNDGFRADKGYVFYITDEEDEFLKIPANEKEGKRFAWVTGNHADKNIHVGGMVIQNEFA